MRGTIQTAPCAPSSAISAENSFRHDGDAGARLAQQPHLLRGLFPAAHDEDLGVGEIGEDRKIAHVQRALVPGTNRPQLPRPGRGREDQPEQRTGAALEIEYHPMDQQYPGGNKQEQAVEPANASKFMLNKGWRRHGVPLYLHGPERRSSGDGRERPSQAASSMADSVLHTQPAGETLGFP